MARRYVIMDVFADRAYAGNPLAVVPDAAGLSTRAMQTIAQAFNLSETVFLLPPDDPAHAARARIFTPTTEMPFAGHPTVGAAVHLALSGAGPDLVIEENVGPFVCEARATGPRTGQARFATPRQSAWLDDADPAALALALGLDVADIGVGGLQPGVWSAGVGFTIVPVRSRAAVDRARPDLSRWSGVGPPDHSAAYVYCLQPLAAGHDVYARMFAPDLGVLEDPATGSAAAAFAGHWRAGHRLGDGTTRLMVEQGYAMGRPSVIELTIEVAAGALTRTQVGGAAVVVREGVILHDPA